MNNEENVKSNKETHIWVDADACPVVRIVEKIAEKYTIPVTLLCDTNHVLQSDYSDVIVVGAGADAVDYKLISICHKGDIVVSQDYGVAAMALGKGAYAIHQSGKWYTNDNIDRMLMERHLNKKARRASGKNHIKGPKKRTSEDDEHFSESFEKMIFIAQHATAICCRECIRKWHKMQPGRKLSQVQQDYLVDVDYDMDRKGAYKGEGKLIYTLAEKEVPYAI